jgi:D-3-phosphoglycerate dehydrogenase
MSWNVCITDLDLPGTDLEQHELAAIGASLSRLECRTEDDVIASCQEADALMVQWAPITARVLANLPRLKAISRYGIGYDMIDTDAAAARGIPVANVPHYCTEEVATHTFALLLAMARQIVPLARSVGAGEWSIQHTAMPVRRLRGQVLGLVGGGRIGRLVGEMGGASGLTVQTFDPYLAAQPKAPAGLVGWEELLATSDFISIHCPLNRETAHLFGADAFARMKPSSVLINASRGGIVDTAALIDALRSGLIAGAALDVLEREPPLADDLAHDIPNLLVTPHAAWYSEESLLDLQRLTARAIVEMYQTGTTATLVNSPVAQSS